MKLFDRNHVVGIFRGFSEGGLEFHADLVLPYRSEFQRTPMHGMFLVVQLEHEDEAVLGRITSIAAQGRLVSDEGDDYSLRAVTEDRAVPEDLREKYLRYRVDIRVLGVVRVLDGKLVFAPSHRRLPHVGSKVAFLSPEVLREVAGHHVEGAEIGHLALGEFVYAEGDARLKKEAWMVIQSPCVIPKFPVSNLVSRRTFVFARAGFGKSNLIKLLFSNLYAETPTVEKRGGRRVPVGSVIFDPDGEYFFPDDKNRPGLCDVPELQDKIVVFTDRQAPSPFYASFIASGIKLDIRQLRPAEVLSIALSPERQDQQNVRKLKMLTQSAWREIVDEIYAKGHEADDEKLKHLLQLRENQEAELNAARANMVQVVQMLHDPSSAFLDMLLHALHQGKLCVVDVSQVRGSQALVLSGIILQRIFEHNQRHFTEKDPKTIPTIAVVEEAQSVLGASSYTSGEGPYIAWVKEGRKYDLGAILITQQPGSISNEILSQGDNWFIFHLLSEGDLRAVQRANAHFSADILSSLLNEPIQGQGVFWSSAGGKPYPIPIRVLSFEQLHKVADPTYDRQPVPTFADRLRQLASLKQEKRGHRESADAEASQVKEARESGYEARPRGDRQDALVQHVSAELESDEAFMDRMRTTGDTWINVQNRIEQLLPDLMVDAADRAHRLLPLVMNELFGKNGWKTENRPQRKNPERSVKWIVLAEPGDE
ncbi:ATP-binding protein [Alicyclobacillus acidocaldarius]|uniref:ATP-binding protein n=1 Tax=Alicyclobacillus acidocaldarius TaxID=405212 RepID=UPI00345E3FD3